MDTALKHTSGNILLQLVTMDMTYPGLRAWGPIVWVGGSSITCWSPLLVSGEGAVNHSLLGVVILLPAPQRTGCSVRTDLGRGAMRNETGHLQTTPWASVWYWGQRHILNLPQHEQGPKQPPVTTAMLNPSVLKGVEQVYDSKHENHMRGQEG